MNALPRLAITHGDINGVGYEVILKTFEDERMYELCTPVLYGSGKILNFYRKQLGINTPFNVIDSADQAAEGILNVINCVSEDLKVEPGISSSVAGEAALASLEAAMRDVAADVMDALVTAPINKNNIQSQTFTFPGHTEYLESVAGSDYHALMILTSDDLRVALVTTHMPLSAVPEAVTTDAVFDKLKIFNRSLHRDFAINSPRIAVLSLNPHAGEDGLLGHEEKDIIIPAIERAKENKILAFGPYASDGFFGSGRFVKFDGVLAMYHDQGLTPFKALAMDTGVNFTAGLPWVRTSPDHGTGYDITGRGEASPESMRRAIYSAIDILRNREREDEAHANPLRRMYVDKSGDKTTLNLNEE